MECTLLKIMQRLVKVDKLGKVTLSLRVQIMEDSGGLLSVCINTLILCLYLSGIEMISVPYSVSVGIVRPSSDSLTAEDLVILDPTDYEIVTYCSTALTILCDPETGNLYICYLIMFRGNFTDYNRLWKWLIRSLITTNQVIGSKSCCKIYGGS